MAQPAPFSRSFPVELPQTSVSVQVTGTTGVGGIITVPEPNGVYLATYKATVGDSSNFATITDIVTVVRASTNALSRKTISNTDIAGGTSHGVSGFSSENPNTSRQFNLRASWTDGTVQTVTYTALFRLLAAI